MRRIIILIAAILLPAAASAELAPFELNIGGGISMQTKPSDFSNFWNDGRYFTAELGQKIGRFWYLTFSVEFGRYSFRGGNLPAPEIPPYPFMPYKPGPGDQGDSQSGSVVITASDDEPARTVSILAGARLYASASPKLIAPFLIGGVGYYNHKSLTYIRWIYEDIMDRVGFNAEGFLLAAGFGFEINAFKHWIPYFELRYNVAFPENSRTTQFFPLTAGLRLRP